MRPVLFELFGVPFFSYGIMLGLSCVAGFFIASELARRDAIPERRFFALIAICVVAGVVGGRVHDVLVEPVYRGRELESLAQFRHGGRTAYGGILAAIAAGALCARPLGVPFFAAGDAVAPTFGLGLAITRIGCFLAGCDFGIVARGALAPIGVAFPRGSPAFDEHVARGLIAPEAAASLPVVPAQLLSSLKGLICFFVCLAVWRRRPRRAGDGLLAFFISYGILRALVEQVRDDPGRGELLGLSTSTTIGLASASIAALALLVPALARLRPPAPELAKTPMAENARESGDSRSFSS